MKLILWSPSSGGVSAKTPEYLLAKRFQLEVEVADVLSVQALQAGILIALYEICHAVYPSAYLSVGACARLGVALGVDRWGCLKGVEDWVEGEEKNRIWWSVMILDRWVVLSLFPCAARCLSALCFPSTATYCVMEILKQSDR